jgi:outer membrane lipoprotein carrier protein
MYLAALSTLVLLAPTPPAAPAAAALAAGRLPVATVVEKMQKNYDQAKDFKARFTQKVTNVAFNRVKVSTGEVVFKKPGRMRWDYDKPEAQMFLATGQEFWMYEPQAKQAFRQNLKQSQLPAALAFLLGKGKLSDEFEIVLATDVPYGTPVDYRLSLKPKQPQSTYKAITFVVDPKTFLVTQSVLVNAQGDINDISFSDIKVNTKIADSVFKWTRPPDVKVIDTSRLGKQ